MIQVALEGFLKKHICIQDHCGISSFQPLTNFKKNPNIGGPKCTFETVSRILKFVQVIKLIIAEL